MALEMLRWGRETQTHGPRRGRDVRWRVHAGWLVVPMVGLLGVSTTASGLPATPEDWIERMNDALLPTQSMTAKAVLTTTDASGSSNSTEFDFARSTDGEKVDRTLIEVTAPEAGKGIVYQIVARDDDALESWVWIPSVGRLRSIRGIHRTDAFLGSEFTYEDLGLAAPVERRDGNVYELTANGERSIVLDSGPYHYYGRVQTYIDPDTGLPQRVLYFDQAGQRFREQRFLDVQEIDGHPFPRVIEVEDNLTGTKSRLVFGHVQFGAEIDPARFSDSIVRKRLRRGDRLDVPAPPE